MLQRLAAAVRGWRQSGTLPAFVALVTMSTFFAGSTDDPCSDSCFGSLSKTVPEATVEADLWSDEDEGAPHGIAAGAVQAGRKLVVIARTVAVGAAVRVQWTPPEGATSVTFTPAPKNPQGPPPYEFENVPAKVAGSTAPSITVRYSVPAAPGPSAALVDGVDLVDADGNHYAYAYAEGGSASPTAEENDGGPTAGTAAGDPAEAALLDRKLYEARTWIYGHDTPLTEQSCQAYVDLLQSRKVFMAFRFPAQRASSLAAGDGGYYLPMSLRAAADTHPVLSFEHRSASSVPLPSFSLEFAPEWLSWAENNLPRAAGERWMTLAVPAAPKVTCTPGLNIPEGGWELYVGLPFDLGPGTGASDRVVSVYACSAGDEPPPIFPGSKASASVPQPLPSRAEAAVMAAGPVPVRIPGELPGPTFTVSNGSVRRVPPPAAVNIHFELNNRGEAVEANITAAGTGAAAWRLYRGTATAPNTGQAISGPISIGRNTVHVWAVADVPAEASGLEVVTVTATDVAVPSQAVWNTAVLWIGDLSAAQSTTWVPVASHVSGANQSQWRTDLGLLNPGTAAASAEVTLHSGATEVSKSFTVQAGEQLILTDVVGQLPFTGSGSLEITSSAPLKVSSRTYNLVAGNASCYPGGTFGQGYDAEPPTQGLAAEESGFLNQLAETAAYRTNIALTNTGTTAAAATVELYDGAGGRLTSYNVALQPGEWKQENRPFASKAGQTNLTRGYAVVTVTSGSGVVATASLIDNKTNDPTTMPMVKSTDGPTTRAWIPVASHASGANQSQWRTDLGVFNPGAVAANLELRLNAGGAVKTTSASVAPHAQAVFVDVVGQFPYTGSGAIEVLSSHPTASISRTYNLVASTAACYPGGTFGQEYRATRSAKTLTAGESGWLTQLVETQSYRTNIAVTNTGTSAATVRVALHDRLGARLTEYEVSLAAGEWKQENRPFWGKANRSDITAGYARITVVSGSGIVPVASVVDNATNDPTTMVLIR